ncbi:hypothetical protein Pcinc_005228 [Petrolisthes cinctipes]|uniref:Uncharacterized protein n=1 Tax=Petrolisthes cinctipes TaxID=88211 RepID=A0AAE1L0S6_PETCI|nr:hypothetical protein Pcinc_005228 [Petrolisthes cinctipes]
MSFSLPRTPLVKNILTLEDTNGIYHILFFYLFSLFQEVFTPLYSIFIFTYLLLFHLTIHSHLTIQSRLTVHSHLTIQSRLTVHSHLTVHSTSLSIPPHCPFHLTVHLTSLFTPPHCPFHLTVHSTSLSIPPHCPFHLTVHLTSTVYPLYLPRPLYHHRQKHTNASQFVPQFAFIKQVFSIRFFNSRPRVFAAWVNNTSGISVGRTE